MTSASARNQLNHDIYRAAVEHNPDGVLITVPDGRILYANQAACSMLGRTEEEICRVGRQGLSEVDDPRWVTALEERARLGRVRTVAPMVRGDGSRFLAAISSIMFIGVEEEFRTVVTMSDVTEEVRLRQRLEAITEITGALLAQTSIGDVLTMIAHHARRLLEASDAGVFTAGEKPGSVVVAAADGPGMHDLVGRTYPPGSLASQVMITGKPLIVADLAAAAATEDGRNLGLGPGVIVPIVAGERVFGNLMVGAQPGCRPYGAADLTDIEMFAEAAGVALGVGEARSELDAYQRRTNVQLQQALENRVVVEQAKGLIAGVRGIGTEEAFDRIRKYARAHNAKVQAVAAEVVDRTLLL